MPYHDSYGNHQGIPKVLFVSFVIHLDYIADSIKYKYMFPKSAKTCLCFQKTNQCWNYGVHIMTEFWTLSSIRKECFNKFSVCRTYTNTKTITLLFIIL